MGAAQPCSYSARRDWNQSLTRHDLAEPVRLGAPLRSIA